MLWLLFYIRRRRAAAEVLCAVCDGLSDLKKFARAARQAKIRFRKLQAVCRDFVIRKKKWVEQATRTWMKEEEKFLRRSFGQLESMGRQKMSEDMRKLRIPEPERRLLLGRWFIAQAKLASVAGMTWHQLVKWETRGHKDVKRFLELCGWDPDVVMDTGRYRQVPQGQIMSLPCFGQLDRSLANFGEQEVLELISQAAQTLHKKEGTFQDHPANKSKSRRDQSRVAKLTTQQMRAANLNLDEPEAKPVVQTKTPVDVDDLFAQFERPKTVASSDDIRVGAGSGEGRLDLNGWAPIRPPNIAGVTTAKPFKPNCSRRLTVLPASAES